MSEIIIEKNKKLAYEIADFLAKNELASDVRIYFNGMCLSDYKNSEWTIIEDIEPTKYFVYANNETVSMSFEGALYHLINYSYPSNRLLDKFNKIFEKHDCYYQLGYAWSLSVYYEN